MHTYKHNVYKWDRRQRNSELKCIPWGQERWLPLVSLSWKPKDPITQTHKRKVKCGDISVCSQHWGGGDMLMDARASLAYKESSRPVKDPVQKNKHTHKANDTWGNDLWVLHACTHMHTYIACSQDHSLEISSTVKILVSASNLHFCVFKSVFQSSMKLYMRAPTSSLPLYIGRSWSQFSCPNKHQLHPSNCLYQKNTSLAPPLLDFYAQLISKPWWANICRAQPHVTSPLLFPVGLPASPFAYCLLCPGWYPEGSCEHSPHWVLSVLILQHAKISSECKLRSSQWPFMWPADLGTFVPLRWCSLSTCSVFSFSGFSSLLSDWWLTTTFVPNGDCLFSKCYPQFWWN